MLIGRAFDNRIWETGQEKSSWMYYAHSKGDADPSTWQSLREHLANTATLAAELGRDAGVSDLARVAAVLGRAEARLLDEIDEQIAIWFVLRDVERWARRALTE